MARQLDHSDAPAPLPDGSAQKTQLPLRLCGFVEEGAGVSANLGKTRVYSATPGPPPPGIAELGADGDKPPAERGVLALGTPVGTQRLLDEIAELLDLQSSWLLLDAAIWRTLQQLLGSPGDDEAERGRARQLAFLPARFGGLGLSSACRLRPAANWAASADALPVLHQRRPDVAARCVRERLFEEEAGWKARPAWPAFLAVLDLPRDSEITGWQRHAASALNMACSSPVRSGHDAFA